MLKARFKKRLKIVKSESLTSKDILSNYTKYYLSISSDSSGLSIAENKILNPEYDHINYEDLLLSKKDANQINTKVYYPRNDQAQLHSISSNFLRINYSIGQGEFGFVYDGFLSDTQGNIVILN